MISDSWNIKYILLAKKIAEWSKDPSKKIGAVIIGNHGQVLSQGYNGFPRGIVDDEYRLNDRETKYKFVVHAEMNAIYNAGLSGVGSLEGATMYVWGLPVCQECAKGIIQTGIKHVVLVNNQTFDNSNWAKSFEFTKKMFIETGVSVKIIQLEKIGRKIFSDKNKIHTDLGILLDYVNTLPDRNENVVSFNRDMYYNMIKELGGEIADELAENILDGLTNWWTNFDNEKAGFLGNMVVDNLLVVEDSLVYLYSNSECLEPNPEISHKMIDLARLIASIKDPVIKNKVKEFIILYLDLRLENQDEIEYQIFNEIIEAEELLLKFQSE